MLIPREECRSSTISESIMDEAIILVGNTVTATRAAIARVHTSNPENIANSTWIGEKKLIEYKEHNQSLIYKFIANDNNRDNIPYRYIIIIIVCFLPEYLRTKVGRLPEVYLNKPRRSSIVLLPRREQVRNNSPTYCNYYYYSYHYCWFSFD